MANQTEIWIKSESDNWHARNAAKINPETDRVTAYIKELGLKPERVFEVGCGNGWRLARIQQEIGSAIVCGCDISRAALKDAKVKGLLNREANKLTAVPTNNYDMVIYGFVLYACDPNQLLTIAAEGNRILKDGGYLVIYDFFPTEPHSRSYKHDKGLRTYKMNHARIWLSHPYYSYLSHKIYPHEKGEMLTMDNRVAVQVLRKSVADAFPLSQDD